QHLALGQHPDLGAGHRSARIHGVRCEPGRIPHLAEPAICREQRPTGAAAVPAAADRSHVALHGPGTGRRAGAVADPEARQRTGARESGRRAQLDETVTARPALAVDYSDVVGHWGRSFSRRVFGILVWEDAPRTARANGTTL